MHMCNFCFPYAFWVVFLYSFLLVWLGLLTCKTVSQTTYTVLVETLNSAQSNQSIYLSVM